MNREEVVVHTATWATQTKTFLPKKSFLPKENKIYIYPRIINFSNEQSAG